MIIEFPPSTYVGSSAGLLYPYQDWVFQNAWVSAILIAGIIYILLMAGWVIPKYQPELKGSLTKGYIADDTAVTFGIVRASGVSDTSKPDQKETS